ncbi:MAG: hypothetical protein KatS3mg060_2396 [Dehalococcoidia bacterium]|nr:MAG: hypothetical protein KatS3mg060_2396 [Dehalococcoidia bacterium]
MNLGAMRSVTVGVRDIDEALRLFRDVIGLRVEHDVVAGADLALAWGLAAGTTVRLVELSCGGYPTGRLTLAHYDPPATEAVRLDATGGPDSPTDIGPKAIDFYVHKPIAEAVAEIEAAGYPPRSRPIRHQIGDVESEEVVLTGPDGVPFLIMIGHRHPASGMRTTGPTCGSYSEVATTSVVAGDLTASRRFYGEGLGLVAGTDAEVPDDLRDFVDDLTGVPHGTRIHFLVYQEEGEPSGKYLLVHFFEASRRRLTGRMRPGHLGVSLFSHDVGDLEAALRQLSAAGGAIVAGPSDVDLGSMGQRRIALVRGPNEELFELRMPR